MPNWRKTVVLKDLLTGDLSDEGARTAAAGFADRLRRLPEHGTDVELARIVSELEEIAHADSVGAGVLGGRFSLVDWFGAVLASLYDWADAERVWIGDTDE